MSTAIDHLIRVIEAYCAGRGVSEARASTLIFNGGGRVKQLREGRDIGVLQASKAFQWLSDNWPDGAAWPDGVIRPSPTPATG